MCAAVATNSLTTAHGHMEIGSSLGANRTNGGGQHERTFLGA